MPSSLIQAPKLPYGYASNFGVCLVTKAEGLVLKYRSELEPDVLAEVRRYAGTVFTCTHASADEFEREMAQLYGHQTGDAKRFADDAEESFSLDKVVSSVSGDLLAQEDDAPVIRLINALLLEALKEKASDIHFEPFEKKLTVRFRIDGMLHEAASLQASLAPLLISRIKVMSKLDIAEKRQPQDGRISVRIGGHEVDIRVSTLPAGLAERVVLRLLDKKAGKLELGQLGLSESSIKSVRAMISRPNGIVLVTGPTGSGKTTSLYAMIAELNDRTRNILTIEDPVEYQMEAIGQTQVNPKVDLTFARGLRAILRQDPDIVMVGEIRDSETAQIAVQASLTGHLVLSTLHTNSAAGAITRLVDMGVEPFLLTSSLAGVIAQRLVRVLCAHCKLAVAADKAECEYLGVREAMIYHPKGCSHCRNTGYMGRIGIYEIIMVDDTVRAMIHNKAGEHEIDTYAHRTSYAVTSMAGDAKTKILAGVTTIEEVMRVTTD